MKKNALIKTLIGSGLLLSTVGLSFALTSCSKKSENPNKSSENPDKSSENPNKSSENPDKPNGDTSYLFSFKPSFLGHDGKDASEGNLILESEVKKILDEKLDVEKGYNEDFFKELEPSFENNVFVDKNDGKNGEVNYEELSFGDIDVYYLNIDNIEKAVNFDINDKMLDKCHKIDDVKKHISFNHFIKRNITRNNDKVTQLLIHDENNSDNRFFLAFYGKDSDGRDIEITKDEDVSKIKKVKINFSWINSLAFFDYPYGLLVKFKPFVSNEKATKSIVIKFISDDEYKFFDPKLYENFDKDISDMKNDYFFTLGKIGEKNAIEYFTTLNTMYMLGGGIDSSSSDEITYLHMINKIFKDKTVFASDELFRLKKYLKQSFNLTLDVEKSIIYKTLCLIPSFSQIIDNKQCTYLLCFGKHSREKYKDEINVLYRENDEYKQAKINNGTYNIPIEIKEGKIVVKILISQLGINFMNKDIEIDLK